LGEEFEYEVRGGDGMADVVLDVDVVYTYVKTDRAEVHREIDHVLSVKLSWAKWSQAYRMGFWDGYRRFYDILRNRFLTGFLSLVVARLMDKGFEVEVNNLEDVFGGWSGDVESVKLNGIDEVRWRETQLPVLRQVLSTKRAVVKMGTGAGKTEVIAGILKALSEERALVLVHRVELLHQMVERLRMRLGEDIGMIGSGRVDIGKRVVVGMVQSVWSKKPQLVRWLKEDVGVLIVDECHHSPSKTWSEVAMACGARWRYGFSGTPLVYNEERDLLLIGLTGDVVYGVQVRDLVEMGYAAKPLVNVVVVPFKYKGSWNEVFEEVYGKDERMVEVLKCVVRRELDAGRKGVVIFVERVRHGKRLLSELRGMGWDVVFVHGGRSDAERVSILEGMRRKRYDVVIATTIFDEGIDVAGIGGVVFWCSTKSVVRIMQRIGRGVRVESGKSEVCVWEFVVDCRYMKDHLKKRLGYYGKEGLDVRYWVWSGRDLVALDGVSSKNLM
jgi:superfamily II DNA or RNA helicase